jgi:transmembrane sensor
MSETTREDVEHDPIYAAAAEWFTRMQQPDLSVEDTLEWQRWKSSDSRNAHAYASIEELWQKFGALPVAPLVTAEALAEDQYDGSVSVSRWRAMSRRTRPHVFTRRLLAIAATVLLFSIAGVLMTVGNPFDAASRQRQVIETAIAQTRSVRFPDGSLVQLGAHTQIEVSFRPSLRQITLIRGEAFFSVAKDRARPFVVRAGSAEVTAVGTEFNVRRSNDRVVVAVIEGRVLVQPMKPVVPLPWTSLTARAGSAASVKAGQRTVVDRTGTAATGALTNPAEALEWQHGKLAFESEPLRYVLNDVNRYAKKPIIVADEDIASLKITGTVAENNIEGWIASLASAFGIHAEENESQIVLRRD